MPQNVHIFVSGKNVGLNGLIAMVIIDNVYY